MYSHINQDQQCGHCSALNHYEKFWRANELIIRCTLCKHEKVIGKLTTASSTAIPIVIRVKKIPDKQIF